MDPGAGCFSRSVLFEEATRTAVASLSKPNDVVSHILAFYVAVPDFRLIASELASAAQKAYNVQFCPAQERVEITCYQQYHICFHWFAPYAGPQHPLVCAVVKT